MEERSDHAFRNAEGVLVETQEQRAHTCPSCVSGKVESTEAEGDKRDFSCKACGSRWQRDMKTGKTGKST